MSVVIVGNGILGLMAARELIQRAPDLKVTVIGPDARPGSASLAAAAMFNSFCEIESGTLANATERERFLFNRSATEHWPEVLRDVAEKSGHTINHGFGTYLINNTATDSLEDENFSAVLAALEEFDEPHHMVDASDLYNYKPLPTKRLGRAVLIEREGWVNPRDFLAALEQMLRASQRVQFVDAAVQRLHAADGRIQSAELGDGTLIEGDSFLVCNGAEFTNLIEASHLEATFQRVFYGVGATLLLECGELATRNCIRTPNRGLACGIYSAPQSPTQVVVGASNFIATVPEAEARMTSIYTLVQASMEQINQDFYRARLLRVNVGWRPTTSDTLPMIGPTSLANLLVATGTKRDGFHCSPVIAQYLADMVIDGRSDVDMSLYEPERSLTRLYTREEAINKYVRHTINSLFQHDFHPSKNRLTEQLETHYREDFSRLHDQVGAHDWGIPIEMSDMYRYGHIS